MTRTRRLSSRKKRQSGVALLVALFVLILLSAIGLGMMYESNTETAINANFKDKQAAIYGSLSGVQEARERIAPALCPPPGFVSTVNYAVCAPLTSPPAGAPSGGPATVFYVLNPQGGETVDPTSASNAYFDTELCQERILGLSSPGSGNPCDPAVSSTMPSGSSWRTYYNDTASSAGPFQLTLPLTTKWTRIIRKSNNMGIVPVNGDASNSGVICWDGKHQVPLPAGYDPTTCGPTHAVTAVKFVPPTTISSNWNPVPNVVIAPSPSGDNATAHAITSSTPNDSVGGVTVTSTGSAYTSAPNVVFTGGGGSGAAAHAVLNLGAPVTGFSGTNLGDQCFTSGATVPVIFAGGGGTGAQGHGVLGSTYNCIYSISVGANCAKNETVHFLVTGGGSGFSSNTVITTGSGSGNFSGQALSIVAPGTGFNGGSLTVQVQDTSNPAKFCSNVTYTAVFGYTLSSLVLDAGGGGYTTAPVASASGGVGAAGLAASATGVLGTLTSGVVNVVMDSPGSGYSTAPSVSFVCPPLVSCGGSPAATATATVSHTYQITGIAMDSSGSGYGSIPLVSFQCPGGGTACGGDGAQLKAILDGSSSLTYGLVYQLTSLGSTSSGARAMTQAEVVTNVRGLAVTGALTLDGPNPIISSMPNSSNFFVSGTDANSCGATQSAPVPAVGVYDDPNANPPTTSQATVTAAIPSGRTNNYYGSGPSPDVENVYGSLGDTLGTTTGLQSLAQDVNTQATINGTAYGTNPASVALGSSTNYVVDYVNGDLTLSGNNTGYGTLLVTGTLTFSGAFTWNGVVLVIGTGSIQFNGGGAKNINGDVIVANICSGPSPCNITSAGVQSPNTLLPEQGSPTYGWNGGGSNDLSYDHCAVDAALAGFYTTVRPQTTPLLVVSSRTVTY